MPLPWADEYPPGSSAKKDLSEAEISWIMSNSRHPRNVPTDAELIAMQRRGELPSDAELARDDN